MVFTDWLSMQAALAGVLAADLVAVMFLGRAARSPVAESPLEEDAGPPAFHSVAALPLAHYAALWQRDVSADFNPPPPPPPATPAAPPVETKLTLQALLSGAAGQIAVVRREDGRSVVLTHGATRQGLRLVDVAGRAAVVERDGQVRRLELPPPPSQAKVHEVAFSPPARRTPRPSNTAGPTLQRITFAERRRFLEEVRLEPHWDAAVAGKLAGLRIAWVQPGGAHERAGLAPGDLLVRVADEEVTTLADVARLYDLIVVADEEAVLGLRRGGREYRLVLQGKGEE